MKLLQLAEHFERLDGLTSRNAMVDELARLFKSIESPEEMREVVYLTEGILLPPFASTEIGISEQFMSRAIAQAAGKSVERVKELYRDTGDYGLTAEKLITWAGEGITIHQAYNALLDIAKTGGRGSIESKVEGLARLIRRISKKEARYLLRVPMGKLRLGVGDPTIMDGLACAYDGRRNLRPIIENAYNLCADMGLVAGILLSEGPERLKDFRVLLGSPIRVELAERAESIDDIVRRLSRCAVEPKYDGFRCQVHKNGDEIIIFTRNLEDATHMFPEFVEAARSTVKAETAIFEGEAVSFNPKSGKFHPFQVTVQRKRKHLVEAKEKELPLRLMAFDCLFADGLEMLYQPYTHRREALLKLLGGGNTIAPTDALVTDSAAEIEGFFNKCLNAGFEGIMAKSLISPYMAGRRTFDWIKFKRNYAKEMRDTADCAIVGYFAGRGKRAQWGIGSLLCAVYNSEKDRFETITKVATGLTDKDWKDMKETLDAARVKEKPARVESVYKPEAWVEPRYVTEILFDEITRSPSHTAGRDGGRTGYALRFPRIITPIRADKKAEDATTVQEIKELFAMQHQATQ